MPYFDYGDIFHIRTQVKTIGICCKNYKIEPFA